MRKLASFAPCLAIALAVALPLNVVVGAETLRKPIIRVPGIPAQTTDAPAPLGPMPRLDPIQKFITPIDPWTPDGFGWNVDGLDDQGNPICQTNHRPTPTCDPDGPRAFLHAGFDAAPAPDRVVHASAAGRVVIARPASAFVTGRSQGEGAGIVVLEHDRDGDPATGDDHLLTVYGHVDPEVVVGQIVAQGDRIALTSTTRGDHLHFAVRQGAFVAADLDVFRAYLPPPGTLGCATCDSRPLPAPAFPDLWQDPAQIFVGPPFWLSIYGERNDGASDVMETADGYLAFGYTGNQPGTPGRSMAVRRLDREGNLVSQRAWNASGLDSIKHVERTPDGGLIALAVSVMSGGVQVPMLVKFDAAGEPQWARQYGVAATPGIPPVRLWWEDIAVTADGGYIVTGTAQGSSIVGFTTVAVARLDTLGNVQWLRTYTPRLFLLGVDGKRIAPTADGGFVVVAEYRPTSSPPTILDKDLLVFRIDAAGEVLWGTVAGGSGFDDARAGQIEATPDGGAIVAGYRAVADGFLPSETWVVKMNGDGTIAWSSLYASASGLGTLGETGSRLVLMSDGGYVIAGQRTSIVSGSGPDTDLVLLRLDGAGEVVGQRRLDSLGASTTPLGLRAAGDGGFLLAGGVDSTCRGCPFLADGAARFVVAHLDDKLDCAGQCTVPYDLVRYPGPPGLGAVGFQVGALTGTWVDTTLTRVDTADRRHPCDHGFFGAPPTFDPASINTVRQTVTCDITQYVEALVCSFGFPGVRAASQVMVDVAYDSLPLTAHVVDGDSTPDQNDLVSVTAEVFVTEPPDPRSAFPMLDDGSRTSLPIHFSNDVVNCTEDPVAGACYCTPQNVPAYSGDVVSGDGVYTFESSLIFPAFPPVYQDVRLACVTRNRSRFTLFYNQVTAVSVVLRATDRIGNVVSASGTVTPSATTSSCTGDACGCCLVTSPDPVTQCPGLPGMPTPDYPDGLCRAF